MEFLIVSGLSGAGKSTVMSILEDSGYFCVDNLPPVLIPKFAEMCMGGSGTYERVAMVCDIRGGMTFDPLFEALKTLNPFVYETLCSIKEMVGEYFIEFRFWDTDLVGVKMLVYADLETKKLKVYALSHIYFMVALELRKHTVWKIEE